MMKHPRSAAFVRAVMEKTGASNPTELSKQLGGSWVSRDQQRKLYKWHAGETAPNFDGTMALLELAGLLTEAPEPLVRPLRGRGLDADAVARAIEEVSAVLERLLLPEAEPEQSQAARAKKRRRAS